MNKRKINKNRSQLVRLFKSIWQPLRFGRGREKNMLFVFGCQRSGTTLLTERIFDRDMSVKVYKEVSELSRRNVPPTRLDPLRLVKARTDRDRARLLVLKPLVESQNARGLLSYFGNSRAVWLYRHHKDVAASNLRLFGLGNGIRNLGPMVRNEPGNWRSEHVPQDVRKIVTEHFSENMNPHDAAALFWFVRNRFFFDLGLDRHPRVMMCRYEELAQTPSRTVRRICEFAGHPFPGEKILREVHSSSLGKGSGISLSRDVAFLCEAMLERLDEAYERQRAKI